MPDCQDNSLNCDFLGRSRIFSIQIFPDFVRLIVAGEKYHVEEHLGKNPLLAEMASPVGAPRQESESFFFKPTAHRGRVVVRSTSNRKTAKSDQVGNKLGPMRREDPMRCSFVFG